MEIEIKIKLITETDEEGNKTVYAEFNPAQLEELSLSLISTERLRETSLLSSAYIIATSVNPEDTAKSLMDMANDILKEGNQPCINC